MEVQVLGGKGPRREATGGDLAQEVQEAPVSPGYRLRGPGVERLSQRGQSRDDGVDLAASVE